MSKLNLSLLFVLSFALLGNYNCTDKYFTINEAFTNSELDELNAEIHQLFAAAPMQTIANDSAFECMNTKFGPWKNKGCTRDWSYNDGDTEVLDRFNFTYKTINKVPSFEMNTGDKDGIYFQNLTAIAHGFWVNTDCSFDSFEFGFIGSRRGVPNPGFAGLVLYSKKDGPKLEFKTSHNYLGISQSTSSLEIGGLTDYDSEMILNLHSVIEAKLKSSKFCQKVKKYIKDNPEVEQAL